MTGVQTCALPISPGYQWKVNGSNALNGTNATFSYAPAANDVVTCVLTSSETCTTGNPATSNAITMTVNPILAVSVSISATSTTMCAGTSVILTATPVNGGSSPQYAWYKNATLITGATNSTYTYVPVNGDAVYCKLTSNALCTTGNPASSNTVTFTVNPLVPVTISIAASSTAVYSGTQVTFTATITNGGTTPFYQWKVNGTNAGTNSATYVYTPVNGDVVTCQLTSSITCPNVSPAVSNSVTMTVITVPATLTLQGLDITDSRCYDATQVITVAGGGTTFIVESGAVVKMIAGQKISLLTGTKLKSGGYYHGYITTTGQYCLTAPVVLPAAPGTISGQDELPVISQNAAVKIYPNPTTGMFTLELTGVEQSESVTVNIYSMKGDKINASRIDGSMKHEFSLSDEPSGIYLFQVITAKGSFTTRIVKK